MQVFNNYLALEDVTAPVESDITSNTKGESLTVQVSGDAISFEIELLGQADYKSDEFYRISGINLTGYSLADKITANGIYEFPINGLGRYKFKVAAISGGKVSVFCKVSMGV